MNRTILGGSLLSLLLGAPLLASAANGNTTFGALKNFNSASQEVVSPENTLLSPMADADLAKVEGSRFVININLYDNSVLIFQTNVYGNNNVNLNNKLSETRVTHSEGEVRRLSGTRVTHSEGGFSEATAAAFFGAAYLYALNHDFLAAANSAVAGALIGTQVMHP